MKTFEQLIADNYLTKKPSLEALRAALGRMIDSLGPDALFSLRNEVEICASFFAGSAPKKKHLNSADYVSQFVTSDKTRPSLAYVYVNGGKVMAPDARALAFAHTHGPGTAVVDHHEDFEVCVGGEPCCIRVSRRDDLG